MSHQGPMYETRDITGWSAGEVAKLILAFPGWADAEIMACHCELCGDVVELVRRRSRAATTERNTQ